MNPLWTPERQREENEQERVSRLCVDGTDNHERVRSDDLVLDSNPPKFNWICARCGKRGTHPFAGWANPPRFDLERYIEVLERFPGPRP